MFSGSEARCRMGHGTRKGVATSSGAKKSIPGQKIIFLGDFILRNQYLRRAGSQKLILFCIFFCSKTTLCTGNSLFSQIIRIRTVHIVLPSSHHDGLTLCCLQSNSWEWQSLHHKLEKDGMLIPAGATIAATSTAIATIGATATVHYHTLLFCTHTHTHTPATGHSDTRTHGLVASLLNLAV